MLLRTIEHYTNPDVMNEPIALHPEVTVHSYILVDV